MYPYEELHELRKSGELERAYERGLTLLRRYKDDAGVKSEFGKILLEKAQSLSAYNGTPDLLDDLLKEFMQLGLSGQDRLYSKVIRVCAKLDPPPGYLPHLVYSAGVDAFRREDFAAPPVGEANKRHRSLVEETAAALGKLVTRSDNYSREVQEFVLEFLDMSQERAQLSYNNLLGYYRALLLGRLGNIEEACSAMEQVVKAKIDEHWIWHALARLEAARDVKHALALCVRAYLLCQQDQYIVQLLSDIRILSENLGRYDLARWAGDKEFDMRLEKGWKIVPPLSEIESAPWYATAKKIRRVDGQLQKMGAAAEESLFSNDWVDGNVVGTFRSKVGACLMKVWVKGRDNELITPTSVNPELADGPAGNPIQAATVTVGRYAKVVRMRPRPSGRPFDQLLEVYGVVDHQNTMRALASIYVSIHRHCLLPYSMFPHVSDYQPGLPLMMRCSRWKGRLFAHEVAATHWQETEYIGTFRGPLRRHERGFGFVGEVFVPPPLVPVDIDIEAISGVCIQKPKWKGAEEMGWTALSVEPEHDYREPMASAP
ncbi:MAG: hypothetical protein OXU68_03090 [Bacteroidota bacterium]|nr:hypothetical protein [Bacteroidota bacterium]MDE2955978.1 hypothetical protein [Bacteroidota bacterium]